MLRFRVFMLPPDPPSFGGFPDSEAKNSAVKLNGPLICGGKSQIFQSSSPPCQAMNFQPSSVRISTSV